jgi:hypothetical protein
MHCRVDQTSVGIVALYITRTIEPVHSEHVHFVRRIVVGVNELHNPAQVVGLSGRFAHKIDLVCTAN